MSLNVRGNDILARLGGDEFAMLLHECTPAQAERVGEKIRQSVESLPVVYNGKTIVLTDKPVELLVIFGNDMSVFETVRLVPN